MGDTTGISWADRTMNFWIGCTEVSVGEKGACTACYAREMAARWGTAEWGNHPRHRTAAANWKKPFTWERKQAAAVAAWRTNPFARSETPKPSCFVFTNSLADIFDNQVDPQWRREAFDVIRATPHLTWLLLTKRPQNIIKLFAETITPELRKASSGPEMLGRSLWPRNAAIGCTVVTQAEADRDVPHLLYAKAGLKPAFAFLSMEPLMEVVSLAGSWLNQGDNGRYGGAHLDWIITGGESPQGKHRARETPDGAFQAIRDQCAWAGVPYQHKQNTGGKGAGRLLDGVLHDARPVVR